jgi:pyruvate dehydrogenase E2 component (dihydrolipoamide acetyltransferase)
VGKDGETFKRCIKVQERGCTVVSKDILMPKLGYDMTEGKLLRWLKDEGDSVQAGEVIFEIETDKVTLEVEASDSGILQHIMLHEGEVAAVGERIGLLVVPGEK